jgi:sodium/hydrogen antiporter
MTLLALFIILLFLYSLVSARLERTVLTAPILFTLAGVVTHACSVRIPRGPEGMQIFLRLAEIGLVMLLFTDASRTDWPVLKRIRNLPARLLSSGMLLTIGLGAVCAKFVFPDLSFWEAGILSAILAPTDAGLGQVIVNSPRVPMKIRQALNLEAGLNDGLSVPFLLFFMSLAHSSGAGRDASLSRFMLEQLGYGALIGAGIGFIGGWLLDLAHRQKWIAESFSQLGLVALPVLCGLASEKIEASMFIASFVAGLAVQVHFKDAGRRSVEFAEDWGQFINCSVFFLFGLIVAGHWRECGIAMMIYAVLSLTVVRMLPVAISLAGTKLRGSTVLFMGWFGPRGLASIVLGLVYLEQHLDAPGRATIESAVMTTVFLSIFAHGLSALPGINLYAASVARLDASAPEHTEDNLRTGG